MDVHKQRIEKITGWLPSWIVTFSLLFIAIGQFSDSIEMIEDAKIAIISNFTYEPDYNKIEKLHINSTYQHVANIMGTPPISKVITDKISADYYINKSHIVAVIHDEKRVKAYYIQALKDDFLPNINIPNNEDITAGESTFKAMGDNIQEFSLDHSRNQIFYLESFDLSPSGLYYSYIQGYSGEDSQSITLIKALYNKEVIEENSDKELLSLRNEIKPNIYGFGLLSAEQLNVILLTKNEIKAFSN